MTAGTKKATMAEFYSLCMQKGYRDMRDPDQCLKAKVIAVDLKLNYGSNMVAFFEKAKQCHTELQQELEAQKLRAKAEASRTAVNGQLLLTLSNGARRDDLKEIRVYLRPDGSVYSTINNGNKIEGSPAIRVEKGGVLTYSYDPGKIVYTGATVGNVHMGGVHTTGPSYSERMSKTGKGDVKVKLLQADFVVKYADMSEETAKRFRRDAAYNELVVNGRIRCEQDSEIARFMTQSALSGGNIYSQMQSLSLAVDERRLEYSKCCEIAQLLGRIVHADFPPADEELYAQAERLAQAEDSYRIEKAIEIFRSLQGYRDAGARAEKLRSKLADAVQKEKEQAVLAREKRRKITKPLLTGIAVVLILVIVAAVAVFGSSQIRQVLAVRAAIEETLPGTKWRGDKSTSITFDKKGNTCTYSWFHAGEFRHVNEFCRYSIRYTGGDHFDLVIKEIDGGITAINKKYGIHHRTDGNSNIEIVSFSCTGAEGIQLFERSGK